MKSNLMYIFLSALLIAAGYGYFKLYRTSAAGNKSEVKPSADFMKLQSYAMKAEKYCESKKLDTDFFILVDLSIHSGAYRFFIWDFKKDTVSNSFLVSHGCYKNPWGSDFSKERVVVSNLEGTHCSSVGKYIIGERGYSSWGINVKYLLHGVDSSNSNSLKRNIVLHAWDHVADEETFPDGTPEGWGCPAISNNSMRAVDSKLKNSGKKVLLRIVQ